MQNCRFLDTLFFFIKKSFYHKLAQFPAKVDLRHISLGVYRLIARAIDRVDGAFSETWQRGEGLARFYESAALGLCRKRTTIYYYVLLPRVRFINLNHLASVLIAIASLSRKPLCARASLLLMLIAHFAN